MANSATLCQSYGYILVVILPGAEITGGHVPGPKSKSNHMTRSIVVMVRLIIQLEPCRNDNVIPWYTRTLMLLGDTFFSVCRHISAEQHLGPPIFRHWLLTVNMTQKLP